MALSAGNQWDEVRDAFHRALDFSPKERASFLASLTNVAVRGRVEELLETAMVMNSSFLETAPDLILKGRYRIERLLGQGGQASVWLARDLEAGESVVAIKVLTVLEEHASWLRRRFADEWKALTRLRHENIVAVRDFGEMSGLPFLVMEFVEGETLRHRMAQTLTPPLIAAIVRQLGEALGAAHRVGVHHRDLKPENVIITGQSDVKLIDFGIAQVENKESNATITTIMMAGTARYMAPEQFLGISSPQSDIYSLAVMVYEMLSGRCPYDADKAIEIARAQRRYSISAILRATGEIPTHLAPILAAALSLDPDQRPEDAAGFARKAAAIILEPKLSWKRRAERTAEWLKRSLVPRLALIVAFVGVAAWWAIQQWEAAHITPIYETAHASDPLTDGFLPHNDVAGTVVYNNAGDGFEAWLISTGSQGHYHRPLTDAQKRAALKNGWTLTMVAKTLEGQTYADVDFYRRSVMFIMEAAVLNGKLLVRACNRLVPRYEFIDVEVTADPGAYHEYRMTYDPVTRTAKIAVDSKLVISDYRGMQQYQDDLGVDFGCERFRSQRGRGAFKRVRFEISGRRPGSS